jgi:hypothetical protein
MSQHRSATSLHIPHGRLGYIQPAQHLPHEPLLPGRELEEPPHHLPVLSRHPAEQDLHLLRGEGRSVPDGFLEAWAVDQFTILTSPPAGGSSVPFSSN